MEAAAPCPRAHPVDLRWLLSVAAGGLFALLLLLATSPSFQLPSSSAATSRLFLTPASRSSSARPALPPLFVEPALSRPPPPPAASLPRFAYVISGSAGDAGMMRRCLLALYHPRNRYVLHLDAQAPDADRADLAAFVAAHPVLAAAGNVKVVEKANLVTYRGPTMVTTTLHAAALLLWGDGRGRGGADWDWFINLSASDYPLVTQDGKGLHWFPRPFLAPPIARAMISDRVAEPVTLLPAADLMHVFSKLPRDLNFIDHTSNISWKAYVCSALACMDCSSCSTASSFDFCSWQLRLFT